MGYQVRFGILEAGAFGVSQSRKRAFILAASPEDVLSEWPEPMHVFSSPELKITLSERVQYAVVCSTANGAPLRAITAQDTIGELPAVANGASKANMEICKIATLHATYTFTSSSLKIPKRPGADWCDLPDEKIKLSTGQVVDLIPWCLPNTAKRHNQWKGLFDQDRILTVHECAQSQGFPDCYQFSGNIIHKHRQIGNVVPPALAFALGRKLKKAVEKKETLRSLSLMSVASRNGVNTHGFQSSSTKTPLRPRCQSELVLVVAGVVVRSPLTLKMEDVYLAPVFHVGGKLVRNEDGVLVYEGGAMERFDSFDFDLVNFGDLVKLLEGIGYIAEKTLSWYDFTEDILEHGLHPLKGDAHVKKMREHILRNLEFANGEYHIYVEHAVSVPTPAEEPAPPTEETIVLDHDESSASSTDDGGYESTEDELYKPPKGMIDEDDTETDGEVHSRKKPSKKGKSPKVKDSSAGVAQKRKGLVNKKESKKKG
ncbi:hypothetical protein PIB30_076703 [Stylosanthes scabra]|uniref:DNA (cytosine-5-)-methyltransferase n=1 Tax=Stylosanthes scabra TaxID=79078 RepID=A0ABU6ZP36_9FABA|nr:hypothetical protein [Stylosanthes scabra]